MTRRDGLEALLTARALTAEVTPLKTDCGRACGGLCCQPDETGRGGMLLFPGEAALYLDKPGFTVTEDKLYYEISEEQRERMRLARRGEEIIYRCEK